MADRCVEVEKTDWTEYWRTYSKTTGRYLWRAAVPDDLPKIRRLQNVTERFLGIEQRKPCLFAPPVLLALVAENDRGQIVDVLWLEAQVEIAKVACTASSFEESAGLQEDLAAFLRARGFRTVVATCMPKLKDRMAEGFVKAGFRCLDRVFSYWARWV